MRGGGRAWEGRDGKGGAKERKVKGRKTGREGKRRVRVRGKASGQGRGGVDEVELGWTGGDGGGEG